MIDLGEQVFFGEYTDENGARRMLKEAAKKICHGIDESRIKLIIKEDRGYITGAWHVQVKEKEYIRILEAQNAEPVRKTEQLERERDAALHDMKNINGNICLACKNHYRPDLSVLKFACKEFGDLRCQEVLRCGKFEWRGVPEKEGENDV